MHGYLVRFLESDDTTFQHIAVWTLIQLLESGNAELEQHIRDSQHLFSLVRQLQARGDADDAADDAETGDGSPEKEIAALSRRIEEILFEEGDTSHEAP